MGKLSFSNFTGNQFCDEALDLVDLQKFVNENAQYVEAKLDEALEKLDKSSEAYSKIYVAKAFLYDNVIDCTDRYDKKALTDWIERNNLKACR